MVKKILNSFLDLLFPRLCICCDSLLIGEEEFLCLGCLCNLPKTDHLKKPENKLEEFFAGRFSFIRIASFAYFVKGGSIQKIVHEFKYRNNPKLGITIGKLCGKEIMKYSAFDDIDYIVPIPLHKKRLKTRGYNQSLMIATGISEETNKPICGDNLIRVIDNPSQTKNSRFSRWKNTEGIFAIRDNELFEGKHILLIDDVITTGSTLEVCAKLILECTNAKISIYALGCSSSI